MARRDIDLTASAPNGEHYLVQSKHIDSGLYSRGIA